LLNSIVEDKSEVEDLSDGPDTDDPGVEQQIDVDYIPPNSSEQSSNDSDSERSRGRVC